MTAVLVVKKYALISGNLPFVRLYILVRITDCQDMTIILSVDIKHLIKQSSALSYHEIVWQLSADKNDMAAQC